MAHYQIILAYDGTQFFGYQRQSETRTVQLVLETALRGLGWEGQTVYCAGRTDTGVHASGQVVVFDFEWSHPIEKLLKAINSNLPQDVAVKEIRTRPNDFHPRFDALSRTYRYNLFISRDRDPILQRFAWRVWPEVELDVLKKTAEHLTGTHDFAAFGTPPKPGGHTIRTVHRAEWIKEEQGYSFIVSANAFLYHMVRRMVYLQVLAGQKRIELADFVESIENKKSITAGLAPPYGLILTSVEYPPDGQELQKVDQSQNCEDLTEDEV
ncbi:MAG: tRNA pseudouridine(38-40) synthase TruA [Anaerolineaceae bacterium]